MKLNITLEETPCTLHVQPLPTRPATSYSLPLSTPSLTAPTITLALPKHIVMNGLLVVLNGNNGKYLDHCCIVKNTVQIYKERVLRVKITITLNF